MVPVMSKQIVNNLLLQNNLICAILMRRRRKLKRKRSVWVREVFLDRPGDGDYHNLIPKLIRYFELRKDPLYIETFRVTPIQFRYLLSLVENKIKKQDTNFRKSISAAERLYITLRYLATGDNYRSLSLAYRVGKSTVCKIIPETCEAIWSALMPIYLSNLSKEKLVDIASDFEEQWNFPHCVGAIDGKHIHIKAPENCGSQFFNYKGTHSIVLMATCDANYKFTTVDIGNYGRISDGGVFAGSALGAAIEKDEFFPRPKKILNTDLVLPYYFVGDAAFPLKEHMMRPYPGTQLERKKDNFNYRLSRARRCIENAFGILSSRFRVLLKTLEIQPQHAESVVKAAVCLHNFLMTKDNQSTTRIYCPHEYADYINDEGEISDGAWRAQNLTPDFSPLSRQGSNTHRLTAGSIRDDLASYFLDVGAVAWQELM